MQTIKRRTKLFSIFCSFPWLREGPGAFADCEEDRKLVALYQNILNQKADVSELDSLPSLFLAVKLPETLREATGNSNRGFSPLFYYWNVDDIVYLLEGKRPSVAVSLEVAGFSDDELTALGKSEPFLPYLRNFEKYSNRPEGYYLPREMENQFKDLERKQYSRIKLCKKLFGLRGSHANSEVKMPSQSVPEKTRNEVLGFHNYACLFDGRTRPEYSMHVHHVIPRKWIQRLSLPEHLFVARWNLVAACSGCNIAKRDEVSKADVRFYLQQFSRADHPNNSLIPLLESLRDLQERSQIRS